MICLNVNLNPEWPQIFAIRKAVNNFLIIPDMTIEFQKFRINKFLIAPSTRCVIKVFQIFRM